MSQIRDEAHRRRSTFQRIKFFVNDFFNHSGIHGFSYIGDSSNIHIVEKLFWFCLVCFGVFFCVDFSLESWNKYLHKSTVVSVQRDYYYWNRTTPRYSQQLFSRPNQHCFHFSHFQFSLATFHPLSLTTCPMSRLNRDYYEKYAE